MLSLKKSFVLSIIALALAPFGLSGWQIALAQTDPVSSAVGDLMGGNSGGDPVHVVKDTAETTILNTLRTALIEASTALTTLEVTSINTKETVLDPIGWNMAKYLQQQLTGDVLKWLGGQLEGQNGQIPFVQNLSDYYGDAMDYEAAGFISGTKLDGLCSVSENNQVKQAVYKNVMARKDLANDTSSISQCPDEEAASDPQYSALDRMFGRTLDCTSVTCATYKADHQLSIRQANNVANEEQLLNYSRGMIPQRLCRSSNTDGATTTDCVLTSPAFLTADAASFQINQIPAMQMLQMDEFNEVVANLMSNLTNQAITGLSGILGLSGNPDYSVNVFGSDGGLSYVDALAQDDISSYQTVTANPITESLENAIAFEEMVKTVLAEIQKLEDQMKADSDEFSSCFDVELTEELEEAKATATTDLAIASTTIAILTTLDQQYASSTNATERGSIMSTYMSYESQDIFRTDYQNQQYKTTFLDFTFAQWVDKLEYDIATARQSCGGEWNYEGVLDPPEDDTDDENTGNDQ